MNGIETISGRDRNPGGFERAMNENIEYYLENLNAQRYDQGQDLLDADERSQIKNDFFEKAASEQTGPYEIHQQGVEIFQTLSPEARQWLDDMRQVGYNLSYVDTMAGMVEEFEQGTRADIQSLLDGSQHLLNTHYGMQQDGSPHMQLDEFAQHWHNDHNLSVTEMRGIAQAGPEEPQDNTGYHPNDPDSPEVAGASLTNTAMTP